jgi:hypothetical protein
MSGRRLAAGVRGLEAIFFSARCCPTVYVLKCCGERQSYCTSFTSALQSGHVACSCSHCTRQMKSKLKWLHGVATARSLIASRQMAHASGSTWLRLRFCLLAAPLMVKSSGGTEAGVVSPLLSLASIHC